MYTSKKILIVDDEQGLLELLRLSLNKEGFLNVDCASTVSEALQFVRENDYDLLLLDIMLPDFSGFELCQEIRNITKAPIIFLTALNTDLNKFAGLAIEGDDYITKPFNPLLVISKVRKMLRRQSYPATHKTIEEKVYDYGRFILNSSLGSLIVYGESIECTTKEFELLRFFCDNPNRIFTSSQLYESIWDNISFGDDKTVVMYISKLRKKLKDNPKFPKLIVNQRGVGYKFVPPNEEA